MFEMRFKPRYGKYLTDFTLIPFRGLLQSLHLHRLYTAIICTPKTGTNNTDFPHILIVWSNICQCLHSRISTNKNMSRDMKIFWSSACKYQFGFSPLLRIRLVVLESRSPLTDPFLPSVETDMHSPAILLVIWLRFISRWSAVFSWNDSVLKHWFSSSIRSIDITSSSSETVSRSESGGSWIVFDWSEIRLILSVRTSIAVKIEMGVGRWKKKSNLSTKALTLLNKWCQNFREKTCWWESNKAVVYDSEVAVSKNIHDWIVDEEHLWEVTRTICC